MKFLIILAILAVIIIYFRRNLKRARPVVPVPGKEQMHDLLLGHVHFYKDLPADDQAAFRQRVRHFLDTVTITPVGGVQLRDLDRLYVAASAIIPIFSFPDWSYNNLNEVLIYPGAFTKDFREQPDDRNVLGMVGEGAMNRMMILSIQSLRNGFEQAGRNNTGIHEFVHLLDKADGATDGIPEVMMDREMIRPWMKYMHEAIEEIRTKGSDINDYAGSNETEFFAVISEYFFQKPEQLAANHPELYRMLEQMYRTKEHAPS